MTSQSTDDSIQSRQEAYAHAADLQRATLDALERTRQQAAETETVGVTTLAELHQQRQQLADIMKAGDRVHSELDKAEQLQNRLSRWGLKFNRRAARKEAEAQRKSLEKAEVAQKEREARLAASSASSPTTERRSLVVKRHGKKKKAKQVADDRPAPKGLLEGLDKETAADENVQQLVDTDAIIEEQMTGLGAQLDQLLTLSNAMGSEAKSHDRALEEVDQQMQQANHKQQVINNRARRFLTGRVRQEHERNFVLFGK